MFGELRPWLEENNRANEYYKPLTRGLNTVQTVFNPHYELNFIRHFSDKTQYYKKLIDNDFAGYCNILFSETENASNNLIAYKIDKSKKLLHSKIKEIATILSTQNFALSYINSQNADFSIDRQFKESTYIIFYLLSALIKCFLEIQHHFRDAIHEDNLMEISDFYTQLLQRQVPDNPFIKEIRTLEIVSVPEEQPKRKQDKTAVLAFTYKHRDKRYDDVTDLFNSLKKNNRIAQDTSITDFKHAFQALRSKILSVGQVRKVNCPTSLNCFAIRIAFWNIPAAFGKSCVPIL
jgi:hypothetical protein